MAPDSLVDDGRVKVSLCLAHVLLENRFPLFRDMRYSNSRSAGEDATMESESARMSSAAEARFRIDYPNSSRARSR